MTVFKKNLHIYCAVCFAKYLEKQVHDNKRNHIVKIKNKKKNKNLN